MSPQDWLLFIDETGDFTATDVAASVVGLLVREDDHALRRTLRARIDDVYRGVPYPPHATELNLAAGWLIAALRGRADAPRSMLEREDVALARAADALLVVDSEPLRTIASSAVQGEPIRTLGPVQRWLHREHPGLEAAILARADAARERMRSLVGEVASVLGPGRCVVLAGVSPPAPDRTGHVDAMPAHPLIPLDSAIQPAADRYLATLDVLLERVLALLRPAADGRETARVDVLAAQRSVAEPPHPRVPLMARHVAASIRRAERFPLLAPPRQPDPRTRLIQQNPRAYDANVHPGLVLTDWIANRLRRALADGRTWHALTGAAEYAAVVIEAAPRFDPSLGPLPAAQLDGPARSAIVAALRGEPIPAFARASPGWGAEASALWIDALDRKRRMDAGEVLRP